MDKKIIETDEQRYARNRRIVERINRDADMHDVLARAKMVARQFEDETRNDGKAAMFKDGHIKDGFIL